MKEPGHIYILVNPSIEGLVKIGKTTRDPESRAKELSQATGVATPFYVAYSICVADCHNAEQYMHAVLERNGHKRSPNREFFHMPLRKAIEVLLLVEKEFQTSTPLPDQATEGQETQFAAIDSTAQSEAGLGEHPGRALFEKAVIAYRGLGDEIEDKKEALRLLHQAKALGFPSAYTSLAEHYKNEGDKAKSVDKNESKAQELYEKAFDVLKEGAQKGHGRCYVMMAELYRLGYGSPEGKCDAQNAAKCWKKYFRSQTFIHDDDDRHTTDCVGLSDYCKGTRWILHTDLYLLVVHWGFISFDEEIHQILLPMRRAIILGMVNYETALSADPAKGNERIDKHREFLRFVESIL